MKLFLHAVKSNDHTSVLKKHLENIENMYHVIGDHKRCDNYWCKYLKDLKKYILLHVFTCHMKKINLSVEDFRLDLQNVFSELAKNASKLSNLGITQASENFDRLMACKKSENVFYD